MDKLVDLFFISETKIDSSFRNDLQVFHVTGYKLQRQVKNDSWTHQVWDPHIPKAGPGVKNNDRKHCLWASTKRYIYNPNGHPNLDKIRENNPEVHIFEFNDIDVSDVSEA